MGELTNAFTEDIGMVSYGLAGRSLTVGCLDEDAGTFWILSFTFRQPFSRKGIWIDASLWTDGNLWYD